MNVFDAIKSRRSVRAFKRDAIKNDDLKKILEAARWAPSAGNRQPLEIVVVKDEAIKQRLAQATRGQDFIIDAPVVLVICANMARTSSRYDERGANLYCIQDTAAAAQNIHLAAYALGYATCWIGAFDEGKAAEVVDAPNGVRPVAIIPIGKPAEKPRAPQRIPLSEIVHEEKF
jgi:nitroreductase